MQACIPLLLLLFQEMAFRRCFSRLAGGAAAVAGVGIVSAPVDRRQLAIETLHQELEALDNELKDWWLTRKVALEVHGFSCCCSPLSCCCCCWLCGRLAATPPSIMSRSLLRQATTSKQRQRQQQRQ